MWSISCSLLFSWDFTISCYSNFKKVKMDALRRRRMTHSGRAEFYFCLFFLTNVLQVFAAKVLHLDGNTRHLFCCCLEVRIFFSYSVRSSSGITPFDIYLIPNILPKLARIQHFLLSIKKKELWCPDNIHWMWNLFFIFYFLLFFPPRLWRTSIERSDSVNIWCQQVQILRCRLWGTSGGKMLNIFEQINV